MSNSNCERTIFDPICVYDPIMGRNITYPNICYVKLVNSFRRASTKYRIKTLTVRAPGMCHGDACPEGTGIVCATNFETFPTLCDLKNSNRKYRCDGTSQQYLCNNCGDLTDPENVEPVCAKASYKYNNRTCSACDKERTADTNCDNLQSTNYETMTETDYNSATNQSSVHKKYTYLNQCELECAGEELDYFQAGGCDSLNYAIFPGITSTDNFLGITTAKYNNLGITSVVLGTDGNWYFDALTAKYAGTGVLNTVDFGGAESRDGGFKNLPYSVYLSKEMSKIDENTIKININDVYHYFLNQTVADFLKLGTGTNVSANEYGNNQHMFKLNYLFAVQSNIIFWGITRNNSSLYLWAESLTIQELESLYSTATVTKIHRSEWPEIDTTQESKYIYNERCENKCPNNEVTICGTDNNTYKNSCYAQCNDAGVKHYGKCTNRCLDADYTPVCGDDGVTYWNSCAAEYKGTKYTNGKCNQGNKVVPSDSWRFGEEPFQDDAIVPKITTEVNTTTNQPNSSEPSEPNSSEQINFEAVEENTVKQSNSMSPWFYIIFLLFILLIFGLGFLYWRGIIKFN